MNWWWNGNIFFRYRATTKWRKDFVSITTCLLCQYVLQRRVENLMCPCQYYLTFQKNHKSCWRPQVSEHNCTVSQQLSVKMVDVCYPPFPSGSLVQNLAFLMVRNILLIGSFHPLFLAAVFFSIITIPAPKVFMDNFHSSFPNLYLVLSVSIR